MDNQISEALVSLDSDYGLHARPAAALAKEAQNFSADIKLCFDGREVDAKSILDILTLAVPHGGDLTIRATGEDAEAAVMRIKQLISARFSERA